MKQRRRKPKEGAHTVNIIGLVIFVVGIALIMAEAFTPGTYIVVPGIALMMVGALLMAFENLVDSPWTPVIFLVAFFITFIPVFFIYKRMAPPGRPTTLSSDALIGRMGTVSRDISPGNIRGKVKIDQEIWSATAEQVIPEGIKVKVTRVEGVKLIVRPLSDKESGVWEETLEVEV